MPEDTEPTREQLVQEIERLRQRVAELEQARSAHHPYKLAEISPDIVARFDRHFHCQYANPAITHLVGQRSDVPSIDLNALSDLFAPCHETFQQVFDSGQPASLEVTLPTPQGDRDFRLWIGPDYAEDGPVEYVLVIARDITAENRDRQMIRDLTDQLEAVLHSVTDGIQVFDSDRRLLAANQAAAQSLGYPSVEALREVLDPIAQFEIFDETGQPLMVEQLPGARALMGAHAPPMTICYREKTTGTEWWAKIKAIPLFDDRGNIRRLITVANDITAQRRAQHDLWFTLFMIDHAYEIVMWTDSSGTIGYANEAVSQIFGMPSDQVIGEKIWVFDDHISESQWENLWEEIKTRGMITMEQDVKKRRDKTHWIELRFQYVKFYDQECLVSFGHDITARKLAEAALRDSEVKYRTLFDALPDPAYLIDHATGRILDANTTAARIYGYSHDEFLQLTNQDVSAEPEETAQATREIRPHIPIRYHRKKDGTVFPIEISANLITLDEQTMIVCVAHDITERLRAANAIQKRTDALRSLHEGVLDITSQLEMSALLRRIVERAVELLEADMGGCLYLYEPENHHLRMAEAVGLSRGFLNKTIQPGEGASGKVFVSKKSLLIEDYQTWEGRLPLYSDAPFSAMLVVPLVDQQEVLGVLMFHADRNKRLFTQDDQWLAEIFAAQTAVAITNGRLFTAEREHRQLAEALSSTATILTSTLNSDDVIERILDSVGRVVSHDSASIMLIDQERGVAYVVTSRGYAEMGMGEWISRFELPINDPAYYIYNVIATGKATLIQDTHDFKPVQHMPAHRLIRSYLGIPIRLQGEIIGILNLDSATPGFFTPAHAERLQVFADQVAIGLQNARLHDELSMYAAKLAQVVVERTAELEHERGQLQAILDAMGEGVVYIQKRRALYINRAFSEMAGYTLDEFNEFVSQVLSQPTSHPTMAEWLPDMSTSLTEHGIWKGEMLLPRKNGTPFDAGLTATRVVDTMGNFRGSVIIMRDISQFRQFEAQKDRFINHAAHELRHPISNIKARLYLLSRQPEKFDRHLVVLEAVTDQMTALVEDLLEVTRSSEQVGKLRRQMADARTLIAKVTTEQAARATQRSISLVIDLPDAPLMIYVEPYTVIDALARLVVNALEVSPEGSQVTIHAAEEQQETENYAVIRVQDQGEGISPDLLPQIFDPFFRASAGGIRGTGLGLTVAHRAIKVQGGELTVESIEGQGTTFIVRLLSSAPTGAK